MTAKLSIARAKARFAECIRRAEAGETMVLTRHGRPVARLAPIEARVETTAGDVREPEASYGVSDDASAVPSSCENRRQALERLLEESIWPRVPEEQLGAAPGKRERERILGYGSDGV